jgi:hypothetical protein
MAKFKVYDKRTGMLIGEIDSQNFRTAFQQAQQKFGWNKIRVEKARK